MKLKQILLVTIFILVPFLNLYAFETEFGDFDNINPNAAQDEINLEIYDPLEPVNRVFFYTYKFIYDYGGRQTVIAYQTVVPSYFRSRLSDFLINLREPWNAVNHFAQLNMNAGFESIVRFIFNSAFGLFGFFDIMGATGLKEKYNDLGATLAFYGVGEGPYLTILGPSNLRDTIGSSANILAYDYALDDIDYLKMFTIYHVVIRADTIVYLLDTGVFLKDNEVLIKSSIDPYTAVRTMYYSYRKQQLEDIFKLN